LRGARVHVSRTGITPFSGGKKGVAPYAHELQLAGLEPATGINVACPFHIGAPQIAHSRQVTGLNLYDDLRPGLYRIPIFYKFLPVN